MIQRRRMHTNPHIVERRDLGCGDVVAKLELIELAVLIDRQRSHEVPRRLYSAHTSPVSRNACAFRVATTVPVTGFAE